MKHQTLLKRIFNIGKKEWGRVGIAWGARFLWRTAYMIAWTVLTVLVIQSFGITNLPWFYVAFGLLTMLGPLLFTAFLKRFSNEKNILGLCVVGSILFAIALSMQQVHHYLFIFLSVLTFSVVISQLNIILSLFQEELFSPRESIRTFPVIESAETIGGIAAGVLLTLTIGIIPISSMIVYVSGLLLFIIPIIYFFFKEEHKVTHIKRKENSHSPIKRESFIAQLKDQYETIRQTGFLKGLTVIVLLNAMFLSMIEFQFTTVLEQEVEHGAPAEHSMIFQPWSKITNELAHTWSETKNYLAASIIDKPLDESQNIAVDSPAPVSTEHDHSFLLLRGDLSHNETEGLVDSTGHRSIPNNQHNIINDPDVTVELHGLLEPESHFSPEEALTHGLSRFHIIFSIVGLLMQLLIASRIIGRLGVIQSMIFHSIVSLFTVIGMFFRFGLPTVAIARGNVEGSGVVYKNSYHASFYALNHQSRIYAKEFMEGFIHPLGFALGMGIIILLTEFLPISTTLTDNTIILGAIVIIMLIVAHRLRDHYTNVSKKHLELQGEESIKFDAIEVLSQKGHKDAHFILSHSLLYKKESDWIKIKILDGIAEIKHPALLSEVTNELVNGSEQVQTQAAKTISAYQRILSQHASDKVISRYRIINSLHEVFKSTKSDKLRREIIRALSHLEDENVVKFLLNVCDGKEESIIPDVIFALRMFNDANSAHYIQKFLTHKNPWIKAHTIITLWDFKKFRLKLLMPLNELLDSLDIENQKAALFIIGEIKMKNELHRLTDMAKQKDPQLKFYAASALAKIDHPLSHKAMLEILTHADRNLARKASAHLDTIKEERADRIREALNAELTYRINQIAKQNKNRFLEEYGREELELLHHYYTLLRDFKEVMYLERIMGEGKSTIKKEIEEVVQTTPRKTRKKRTASKR